MKPTPISQVLTSGTTPEILRQYESLIALSHELEFGLEDEVVMLDLETTGLNPRSDRIIEIGMVKVRGTQEIEQWGSLINPGRALPSIIKEITGITDESLRDAPSIDEVVDEVLEFIGDRQVIAYNAQFDRSFLEAAIPLFRAEWADALYLARVGLPRARNFKMASLAELFAPDWLDSMHRAVPDAQALARVWRASLCGLDTLSTPTLAAIAELSTATHPAEARWIRQVLGARGESPATYNLKQVRRAVSAAKSLPPLADAWEQSLTFTRRDEVAQLLSPAGPISAARQNPTAGPTPSLASDPTPDPTPAPASDPAHTFEQRPEQLEMAAQVYDAFSEGVNLAIEAGTGVGKSLAYLVPAALTALEHGISVGVATKTNSLTDQLVNQEIPAIAAALGSDLRCASVKGYENYLCLRKVAAAAKSESPSSNVASVLAWIEHTPWGDVDSMSPLILGSFDRSLRATQPECTKKRCTFYPHLCYIHGARKQAQSAHVVVTNHSLLLRDAAMDGQILPPVRYWIVDEAHGLEREARRQLSLSVASTALTQLLDRRLSPTRDPLRKIRLAVTGIDGAESVLEPLDKLTTDRELAATLTESFFSLAADLFSRDDDGHYGVRAWVSDEVRNSAGWGRLSGTGSSLHGKLSALQRNVKTVLDEYPKLVKEDADTIADLAGGAQELASALDALGIFIDEPLENAVHSVEIARRGRSLTQPESSVREERQRQGNSGWGAGAPAVRVGVEQMDVGPAIVENLMTRTSSIVFTSATLATGNSDPFSHFARSVGLNALPAERWRTSQLPSSYDLPSQMEIYVVSDIPEPRSPGYHAALERLLERIHLATHGGVLTLFTSDRDMRSTYAAVQPALAPARLPLYYQRTGASPRALREQFATEHDSSLFALKRFWEGFDVRGSSLRCVVITKLPFSVPEDPLSLAREAREGSAAWRRYSLPETVIETRQAVGRLIRSSTDAGAIVITDSRLATKNYSKVILRAMPVEPRVLTSDEVVSALTKFSSKLLG